MAFIWKFQEKGDWSQTRDMKTKVIDEAQSETESILSEKETESRPVVKSQMNSKTQKGLSSMMAFMKTKLFEISWLGP